MIRTALQMLGNAEDFLWWYIGSPIVILLGIYLTIRSKGVQIRQFPAIFKNFFSTLSQKESGGADSLHPIRAFFASIGGSLGIGNVVAVAAAVRIGGPGTIVWIWVTAIVGALIKYSEVYIGMSRRISLPDGSRRGGPTIFLKDAFGSSWPATLFCVFLCLYSVEIYQFGVVASVTSQAIGVSRWVTALVFLAIIVSVERGGFQRIGFIASLLVPFAVAIYVSLGSYVLFVNADKLPTVLADIIQSAFSARAAEGAFVGCTLLTTISHGIRRGCYSSDIGIGYASIIHSASSASTPTKQASLLIFEVFVDTFFVCTMSVLLVLVTGTWTEEGESLLLIQAALGKYFPHMDIFMPFFLALLGYSVVSTYFSTGMYTIRHALPGWGPKLFYLYGATAFLTFTFVDCSYACSMMSLVGACLLGLNATAIWKLRDSVSFAVDSTEPARAEGQLPQL
jgi:AGCS family alanine or glycine:cation symporter